VAGSQGLVEPLVLRQNTWSEVFNSFSIFMAYHLGGVVLSSSFYYHGEAICLDMLLLAVLYTQWFLMSLIMSLKRPVSRHTAQPQHVNGGHI
jgi:hypothetical protein